MNSLGHVGSMTNGLMIGRCFRTSLLEVEPPIARPLLSGLRLLSRPLPPKLMGEPQILRAAPVDTRRVAGDGNARPASVSRF